MTCCAIADCGDPKCPVCSINTRVFGSLNENIIGKMKNPDRDGTAKPKVGRGASSKRKDIKR